MDYQIFIIRIGGQIVPDYLQGWRYDTGTPYQLYYSIVNSV